MVFAAFALVTLRVLQQQNVICRYYWWAAFTSYAIAFAEIGLILFVVQSGWSSALYIGTGGAFGVTFAMYIHKRFLQKKAV